MQPIKILTGIIALFILVSCEKDIEFPGETTKPLLVINSLATTDSTLTIRITKSKFFLEDDGPFETVSNASVSIKVNGTPVSNIVNRGDGLYTCSYIPKPADLVRIEVKAPGMDDAYTEQEIPETVEIIGIDTTRKIYDEQPIIGGGYGGYGNNYTDDYYNYDTIGYYSMHQFDIKLKFKDKPDVNNYYRLAVRTKSIIDDSTYNEEYIYFDFYDIVSGNSTNSDDMDFLDFGYSNNDYNIFSDELFDGEIYPLKFRFGVSKARMLPGHEEDSKYVRDFSNIKKIEVYVDLQSISKSYYLYMKTISNYSGENYFSEPVQIHNNIKGGIGIFGSYTKNIARFDIIP
jgi:hypothetical protein